MQVRLRLMLKVHRYPLFLSRAGPVRSHMNESTLVLPALQQDPASHRGGDYFSVLWTAAQA